MLYKTFVDDVLWMIYWSTNRFSRKHIWCNYPPNPHLCPPIHCCLGTHFPRHSRSGHRLQRVSLARRAKLVKILYWKSTRKSRLKLKNFLIITFGRLNKFHQSFELKVALMIWNSFMWQIVKNWNKFLDFAYNLMFFSLVTEM